MPTLTEDGGKDAGEDGGKDAGSGPAEDGDLYERAEGNAEDGGAPAGSGPAEDGDLYERAEGMAEEAAAPSKLAPAKALALWQGGELPPVRVRRRVEHDACAGKPDDVLDWSVDDVRRWAESLGCHAAALKLAEEGVHGEALVELRDVFEQAGVQGVGHLFTLRRARKSLLSAAQLAKEFAVEKSQRMLAARAARANQLESRGEPDVPEEADGLVGGAIASFSERLSRSILRSTASSKAAKTFKAGSTKVHPDEPPPPPPPPPKVIFDGNLTDQSVANRKKQAQLLGSLVLTIELLASVTGSVSIWPHLAAIVPAVLAFQQAITAVYRTCFIAAIGGTAYIAEDGCVRGA